MTYSMVIHISMCASVLVNPGLEDKTFEHDQFLRTGM